MINTYGSIASDINASSFLANTQTKPSGYVGVAASGDYYEDNIVNGYRYSTNVGDRATWLHPPYYPNVPVYPTNTPTTPSDPQLRAVRDSCAAYCYRKYLDPVLLPYTTSGQTIQFILAYGRCSCIQPGSNRYVTVGAGHSYECCKPMTKITYQPATTNASNAIEYDDTSTPNANGVIRPSMCDEAQTYGVVFEMKMDCPLNASFCNYYQGRCGLKTISNPSGKRCCFSTSIEDPPSSNFSAAQQIAQWLVALIVFAVIGQFVYWILRVRRRRILEAREGHLANAAAERLLIVGAQGEGFDGLAAAGGAEGNQIDDNVGVLPPLEAFEREMIQRNRIALKDGIELLLVPGVLMGPPAVVTVWLRNKKDSDAAALEAVRILPYAEPHEIDPEECCPMCTDELTELVHEMAPPTDSNGTSTDGGDADILDQPLLVAPSSEMRIIRKSTSDTNVVRLVCNHMIHRTCIQDYMSYSLKSYLSTITCPICRATVLVQQQSIKQQRLRKELYHFRKLAESEVLRLVQIGAYAVAPRRGYKRGSIVFHDGSPAITEHPFRAFIKPVPQDKVGTRVPITKAEVMMLRREVIETLRQQTMHSVLESLARSDTRDQCRAEGIPMPGDNSTRRKLDREVLSRLTNGDRELLDTMETRVARIQFGDDVQPSYRWRSESPCGITTGLSVLLAALPGSRSSSEESDEGFRFAEAIIEAQSPSNAHTLTGFREAPSPSGAAPRRTYVRSPPSQNPNPFTDSDDDDLPQAHAGIPPQQVPRPQAHNGATLTAAHLEAVQTAEEGRVRQRNRDEITSAAGFAQAADVADDELPLPDNGTSSDDDAQPAAAAKTSSGRRRETSDERRSGNSEDPAPLPSPRSGVTTNVAKTRRRGRSAHRGVEGIPQPINRSKRSVSMTHRSRVDKAKPSSKESAAALGRAPALDAAAPQAALLLSASSIESLDMDEGVPSPSATATAPRASPRAHAHVPMDDDEGPLTLHSRR
jgi:hypothetical protein